MIYDLRRLLAAMDTARAQREFTPMADVIRAPHAGPRTVIWRFDVERALPHHVKLAEILSARDMPCTLYFHTRRGCYAPASLRAIQDLGHEVGIHHECLDRCAGDFEAARELFLREVEMFHRDGLRLRTVCSHGEAGLRREGYSTNWDLFERYPNLLDEAGVQGEVYLWLRAQPPSLLYASDTFSSYRRFWPTLDKAAKTDDPLMVLAHAHRWRNNPITTSLEVARDLRQRFSNKLLHSRRYDLAY